jgi:predicted permease
LRSLPVTQKGAIMSRNTLIAVIIILLIIFGGWSFMGV